MKQTMVMAVARFLRLALSGCGASFTAQRLPTTQLDKINGLVVNQNVPYELFAIFPATSESLEVTYERASVLLPSADEVYVINYSGQMFTSRSLEVELHPDTTVKSVKVDSRATVEESLNNIAAAATQAGELR